MKLKGLYKKISIVLAASMLISQGSITAFASSYEDYIKQKILNDLSGKDDEITASYSDAIDGEVYSGEQAKDDYFRIGFEKVGAYDNADSDDIISTDSNAKRFVGGAIPLEYTADKPRSSGGLLRSTKASNIPDYYSSLSEGYVTSAKDQGYYGTCWAFAFTGAAETSMLKSGYEKLENDNPDYSDLGTAYFFFNRPTDPLGLTEGDAVKPIGRSFLMSGGHPVCTMIFMSGWGGELDESSLEYSRAEGILSGEDKVDSSICYRDNEAIQKNAYVLPRDSSISDVKQAILDHGSVVLSYYASGTVWGAYKDRYTYYDEHGASNHIVMIVGWDDNIPKESFQSESGGVPSSNGGWLIKNSWGIYFDYFWLSYDTPLVCTVAVDFVPADTYENNYHYDGGIGLDTVDINSGKSIGNIYQVKGEAKQEIKAVNLGLYTTGATYTVQIYENSKAMSNPMDGELKYTSDAVTVPYSGLVTHDLTETVVIEPGHYFSVVVTGTDCSYKTFVDKDADFDDVFKSTTTTAEGQSMYMDSSGNWVDAHDDSFCFRIKAFTNKYECTDITVSRTSCSIAKGLSKNISSLFTASPEGNESTFTYTSADTSIATVTSDGTVTAVAVGKTTVTYAADNGKSASITIRVYIPSDGGSSSISRSAVTQTTTANGGVAGSWAASYVPNTATVNGWRYLKSDTGTYATSEWLQINYNNALYWYYFGADSNMVTGWFVDPASGKTYHLSTDAGASIGIMSTGWFFDTTRNAWYYFDLSGALLTNTTTPDGYKVGADGRFMA